MCHMSLKGYQEDLGQRCEHNSNNEMLHHITQMPIFFLFFII
jgi:hypothetical protein